MTVQIVSDWINQCHLGDCLDVLRVMPDASVDSIVTDPPYGLSFMGKKWDYDVPDVAIWAECLRVLKPGGHLLAFAGTRTQHRMACRIEDAGFDIRDMIAWVYGGGFPKSHNGEWGGTALKPALEPITMARKPLSGTVAANWSEHGTGALNIDGCRVGTDDKLGGGHSTAGQQMTGGWERPWMKDAGMVQANMERSAKSVAKSEELGRWPANLIHDGSDEVLALFPQSSVTGQRSEASQIAIVNATSWLSDNHKSKEHTDSGSAARFFYCAKASKEDRNDGMHGFTPVQQDLSRKVGDPGGDNPRNRGAQARQNHHPTVKPTDLMRYLVRLVTPPGGIVLDPFFGSGSTGCAALLEGFQFVGIEREAAYVDIARARVDSARRQGHQPSLLEAA